MPICDDPSATGWYTLRGDREKPIATRPMFECRFITRGQRRKVDRLLEQAYKTENDAGCYLLLAESIHMGVVGWRNIKDRAGNQIPYSREAMDDLLSDDEDKSGLRDNEVWELARYWPDAVALTEDDRKNFGLPATSEQASSVAPAEKQAAA